MKLIKDNEFKETMSQMFGYWNNQIENMNDRDEVQTDVELLESLDYQFTTWQDDLMNLILKNDDLNYEQKMKDFTDLRDSEKFKKLTRMSNIVRRLIVRYKALNELKNRRTADCIRYKAC